MLQNHGVDLIDINMGCPVKKVIKAGAGAILMKDPDRVARIIRAVKKAVRIPVTVKIDQDGVAVRLMLWRLPRLRKIQELMQ